MLVLPEHHWVCSSLLLELGLTSRQRRRRLWMRLRTWGGRVLEAKRLVLSQLCELDELGRSGFAALVDDVSSHDH